MRAQVLRRILFSLFAFVAFAVAAHQYRAKGLTGDAALSGATGVALVVMAFTAKG